VVAQGDKVSARVPKVFGVGLADAVNIRRIFSVDCDEISAQLTSFAPQSFFQGFYGVRSDDVADGKNFHGGAFLYVL
jgi:hypothetical protein